MKAMNLQPLSQRAVKTALAALLLGLLAWLSFSGAEKFSGPERLWRATLENNPGAWMAHGNLARLLAKEGRHEEALGHYLAVTEEKPLMADGFYNLGLELFATGRPVEAEARFRKALELNPRLSEAHQALGFALLQMNRPAEALESFLMVTALFPRRAEGHYGAGLAYAALGRHENAVSEFTLAQNLFGPDAGALDIAEVLLQKGISLEALGRTAGALGCYREAALAAPRYHKPFHRMGAALARLGRRDEAVLALEKALEIKPDFAPARKDLDFVKGSLPGRGEPQSR